jgi:hypothetical protein
LVHLAFSFCFGWALLNQMLKGCVAADAN